MYLLGIDVGTSSIKVALVEADTQKVICTAQYPENEAEIISLKPEWAEQDPNNWWHDVQKAIIKVTSQNRAAAAAIKAIGIAYQMHGLVLVDKNQQALRNSIIWCDSRAVDLGNKAFEDIGKEKCLSNLLNSPGNFTASKLAWVKQNEPHVYGQIYKIMLPGDFIAMKLTGQVTTTVSALSEGILWDFKNKTTATDVIQCYDLETAHIPELVPLFSEHGRLNSDIAVKLGLPANIPVTYKAGDQLNNALSLNVMRPGEVAATAGTSGVIYGVSDQLKADKLSRVNTFAHVNYSKEKEYTGVLLCINGVGSMYRWAKQQWATNLTYQEINQLSSTSPVGSNGLKVLPFGNGAERMLNNKHTGAQLLNISLNTNNNVDVFRAVQEGIAFSFRYGLDIMRSNGLHPNVIRAGLANLFLSETFVQTFVDVTQTPVELFYNDGSVGAALGAGIGAKIYNNEQEAFNSLKPIKTVLPKNSDTYESIYQEWMQILTHKLNESN
ncbi:xylulokinase [Nubsella zeaxanthinifaciens]|uniref:xylulokinase n=1 Tax=Nubsella zeaxanthinifaciens TaxID=392412 RepID=UPI003D02CCEE